MRLRKGCAQGKDIPLGKKMDQGKDEHGEMILPQGEGDLDDNIVICWGSFC